MQSIILPASLIEKLDRINWKFFWEEDISAKKTTYCDLGYDMQWYRVWSAWIGESEIYESGYFS